MTMQAGCRRDAGGAQDLSCKIVPDWALEAEGGLTRLSFVGMPVTDAMSR